MSTSRIEFITRSNCALCDEALRVVTAAARRHGVAVVLVDVDQDPELLARFDERVPAVRDGATGAVLAEGVIDPARAEVAVRTATRN